MRVCDDNIKIVIKETSFVLDLIIHYKTEKKRDFWKS